MGSKTLAMRVLDGKRISYQVHSYSASERNAEEVAAEIDVPSEQVFKTLVIVRPAGKPLLVMIPANKQLNLKKMAKGVGEKKVAMASHAEAEALTGLKVGGISALALLNRGFDIYLDKSAELLDQVYISAGKKGLQIGLSTKDLENVSGARLIEVAD